MCRFRLCLRRLAVQAVPIAGGIVASIVAKAISVVLLTVAVKNWITRWQLTFAVSSIIQTIGIVTLFIAEPIVKHFPTVDHSCAISPRIQPQTAVVAVKVTGVGVALLVAPIVVSLLTAALLLALFSLISQVDFVDFVQIAILCLIQRIIPALEGGIKCIAHLPRPLGRTVALKVAQLIVTDAVVLARIHRTLVEGVLFAIDS